MNTTSIPSQVFLVLATSNPDKIFEHLNRFVHNADVCKIDADKWMVSFHGTSKNLAEKIGIRGEAYVGTGLVVPVSRYSGRADSDLWEWLNLKMK
jgi:hypothetical protein